MPCRCGAGVRSAPLTEDEQRAARTAEIAAAEDFDPLRIRPYVTLTDHAGAPSGTPEG
ncbi:peptidoglycan-binding protein, partial [Streptomyces sp. NPDC058375]